MNRSHGVIVLWCHWYIYFLDAYITVGRGHSCWTEALAIVVAGL